MTGGPARRGREAEAAITPVAASADLAPGNFRSAPVRGAELTTMAAASSSGRLRGRSRWWIALTVSAVLLSGCSGPGSAGPAEVGPSPTAAGESPARPGSDSASAPASTAAAPHPEPDPRPGSDGGGSTSAGLTPGATAPTGCPGVRCVSIAVTGDVLLHPPLVDQARADSPDGQGLDFAPMLAAQAPYIRDADLGICHLETPLAPAGGPFLGYPEFSVPPQVLPALVAAGYDACSTASNHTLDHGTVGVNRTVDDLDAAGLAHDGSYRTPQDAATPTLLSTPSGTVALISVTYGFNTGPPDEPWQVTILDTDVILGRARAARAAGADLVIVAMHAGTEYDTEPNGDQVTAAHTLLASPDVDLVYGHHAHVVQPLQKINGKWVIFGLGNNIAAQETPVEGTHRGLLVRVTFSQDRSGSWSTSDIGWVPSLQNPDPPHRWCPLTAGVTCVSPDVDAAALAATTEAVNLYHADSDGAHPLERR